MFDFLFGDEDVCYCRDISESAKSVGQAFALVIMAFVTLNPEGAGACLAFFSALALLSMGLREVQQPQAD